MTNEIAIIPGINQSINGLLSSIQAGMNFIQEDFVRYTEKEPPPPVTYNKLPGILFITTYPPRQCGIATYSQDLISTLKNKFSQSFHIHICPLESENEKHVYTDEIKYILNTSNPGAFDQLANKINSDPENQMVIIQHEFGLFGNKENEFTRFLHTLIKPVILVFHTVLPHPDKVLKRKVQRICGAAESIIVMTNISENILITDYEIAKEKIKVIPHGTHLVMHSDKELLKKKYKLTGKKVLSTFGLLGPGKSIETTLESLPDIIKKDPDVVFLIIGKTHPSIRKQDGEQYRTMLETKVSTLKLQKHVQFINNYLPLPELLEYLQLTDIYLFTSRDPNQAVSGTFSYAISCGCPVISTPIPHAREVLKDDAGIIIDFENSRQLTEAVIRLLIDEQLRKNISSNGLHRIASTAWENSAIAHAHVFEKISNEEIALKYNLPPVNLTHIKKLTTDFGMIQFSKINQPDIESGYTLDDNARAMIAMCQYYELTGDEKAIEYITIYLNFIKFCLQPDGLFLNYLDKNRLFTEQNDSTNLADSNGRALWALGYLISMHEVLPANLTKEALLIMQKFQPNLRGIYSTRAMAFAIKGLYYRYKKDKTIRVISSIRKLANRLVQMYRHEAVNKWNWFESYLTYANSIIPEAMLCAWLATGEKIYKDIAKESFDFLLSKTFGENSIRVISNKTWLHKENTAVCVIAGGEQPIDVAYTILALHKFFEEFEDESYLHKLEISLTWFLGNNHLKQVIYNPCTGGCYDGLEENYVNLNQGAESTVSYLMARLTIDKYFNHNIKNISGVNGTKNVKLTGNILIK